MLFILNKSMEVVESLNDRGNMSHITPYFDDEYVQDLATGAETFTFSTLGNSVQSQHLVIGNYIAFKYDNSYKLFNIINIDEEHTELFIKHVYCEMASIELINEIVRPLKFTGTVRQFITTILEDTSWNLGILDMSFTETVDLNLSDYKSVYSLLQEHIVDSFKGEMTYRVDIENNEIVGKYVDVYRQRGMDRGVRFSYSKNLSSIKKTVDSSNLATALIGIGKNNITFKDLDLPDKPAGQDFITDEYAYKLWNVDGKHILGTHKEDTDSPQELLKLTRLALKDRSTPNVKYEMKVETLGEKIKIGDTVKIVDHEFNPPLYLEGRVNQLKLSRTDSSKDECILSNFKEIGTNISSELKELAGYIDSQFPIGGDKIKDGAIDGDKLVNGQIIQGIHLFANSITADKIKSDSIESRHIKAESITADKLTTGELITKSAQIGDAVIDNVHIKEGAIDTININDGAITSAKIGDAQIGTAQIADAQITNAKIGKLAVGTANIQDASITNAKIKDLNADKITAGTIDAERIVASVISAINMSVSGTIDASKINVKDLTVDNIDAGKITTGTLNAERIKSSVITAINGTFETAKIDSAKIGNLDANKITTGTIDAQRISGSVISAINISTEKISADKITGLSLEVKDASITNAKIANLAVSTAKIQDACITTAKIGDAQITGAKIANAQIGSGHITDGSITTAKIGKAQINNAHIQDASIESAKIKEIDAGKITTGILDAGKLTVRNLRADSIVAGSITVEGNNLIHNSAFESNTDKWTVTQGWSLDTTVKFEGVNSMKADITGLTADGWRALMSERVPVNIGDSVVVSVWVYSDDISTLDKGAGLEVQWYADETSSRLPHQRGTSIVPTANGVWQRVVYTTIVDEPNTKFMDLRFHPTRNGRMWVSKPMVSKGTIASIWKKHNDELISNGAIDNDKIANESITADKLVIDEIWASEGFVSNFQAQSIDAGQIKTGKITGDLIDIEGMVSFSDLNSELAENFIAPKDANGNSLGTWINGKNIYTGTLTGDQINTRGFTATNQLGLTTFNIDKFTGDVSMSGLVKSSNYSDIKGQERGYMLTPDGNAFLNDATIRGSVILPNGGITDYGGGKANNILKNTDYSLTNKNNYEWDKKLNGDLSATYWGDYNSGVTNPTTGYHAHINTTAFDFNVIEFMNVDNNRWLGSSQSVSMSENAIQKDETYYFSIDVYFTKVGQSINGGSYYKINDDRNANFHSGRYEFTAKEEHLNKWIRFNWSFKYLDTVNVAQGFTWYNYGYGGTTGNTPVYIKNCMLTTTNTDKWSAYTTEKDSMVRFWAGNDFSRRDNAPFRVLQDGSVIATKGNFGGTITGKLNIGNIVIEDTNNTNGYIKIKSNNDEDTLINLEEKNSYIKSNLEVGTDFINFDAENKIMFNEGKCKLANGIYSTILNNGNTILETSDGKGLHRQFYWDGCMNFSSNGNQSNNSDFRFEKNNGTTVVKVDVMGELYAKDKITMNNNIAIVSRQDAGNSGFDYVVN